MVIFVILYPYERFSPCFSNNQRIVSAKISEVMMLFVKLLVFLRYYSIITSMLTNCWIFVFAAGKTPLLEGEELEEGKDKKEKESRPVSYSYMFFHLIFALASMYSAMLLSGWTNAYESSDLTDVGWTSTWVRICTEWVTGALYVWSLVAPLVFRDREFF